MERTPDDSDANEDEAELDPASRRRKTKAVLGDLLVGDGRPSGVLPSLKIWGKIR